LALVSHLNYSLNRKSGNPIIPFIGRSYLMDSYSANKFWILAFLLGGLAKLLWHNSLAGKIPEKVAI